MVYAKPPFGGPEHVLQYLARYTHRVAISNHRLLDITETHVTFRWKDYIHHHKHRTMIVTHEEFLRRFLQHVLPKGFPRIRYFGFLANRRREQSLMQCRALLPQAPPAPSSAVTTDPELWCCPLCRGSMCVMERLTAAQILNGERHLVYALDSS